MSDEELSPDDERQLHDLRVYRERLHDVSDEQFEALLQPLRERQSIQSIPQEPINEEWLGAHLSQIIVRTYLGKIHDARGLPRYVEQAEAVERIDRVDTRRMQVMSPLKAGRP